MAKRLRIYLIIALAFCLVTATLLFSACDEEKVEHVHSYGEWAVTPASCEVAGERTRKCSECEHVQTETIDALGHDWQEVMEIEPATCEENGLRSAVCSRCDATEDEQIIPALGHDWKIEQTVFETCQHGGQYLHTCKRTGCTASKTTTTEPVDHKWSVANTVEATCESDGSVTYKCDYGCQTPKVDTVNSLGHSFSNSYTVDEEPTYEQEGAQSRHCTRNGCNVTSDKQTIPKKEATYSVTVKDPCGDVYYFSATVSFYVNDVLQEQVTIASNEVASFTVNSPNCNVKITELRKGYYADENGYDVTAEQPNLTVRLGAALNEVKTIWHHYYIGDIFYDETYTYYVGEDSTAQISTSKILSQKKGILINFYYNGCSPCNYEMADLIEVANQYKDEVQVLMIDILYENETLIKTFRSRNNAVYSPLYFLTEESNKKAFQDFAYKIKSAPWTACVDCNGQLVYWNQGGAMSKSAFQSVIQRYILDRYDKLHPSAEKANNNSATISNVTTIAIIPSKKFGF